MRKLICALVLCLFAFVSYSQKNLIDSDTTFSKKPLFIVDGEKQHFKTAMEEIGFFAKLDKNTIETIDVIKNPDASTIYGDEGIYGVILISTNRQPKKDKD